MSEALGKLDEEETRQISIDQTDRGEFRVGNLYKNKYDNTEDIPIFNSNPNFSILINYLVNVGDKVQEGDTIAILEAMKMENQLPSPTAGIVNELMCDSGSTLAKGDVIAIISPETTK